LCIGPTSFFSIEWQSPQPWYSVAPRTGIARRAGAVQRKQDRDGRHRGDFGVPQRRHARDRTNGHCSGLLFATTTGAATPPFYSSTCRTPSLEGDF
jgi:hypothetical protein